MFPPKALGENPSCLWASRGSRCCLACGCITPTSSIFTWTSGCLSFACHFACPGLLPLDLESTLIAQDDLIWRFLITSLKSFFPNIFTLTVSRNYNTNIFLGSHQITHYRYFSGKDDKWKSIFWTGGLLLPYSGLRILAVRFTPPEGRLEIFPREIHWLVQKKSLSILTPGFHLWSCWVPTWSPFQEAQ